MGRPILLFRVVRHPEKHSFNREAHYGDPTDVHESHYGSGYHYPRQWSQEHAALPREQDPFRHFAQAIIYHCMYDHSNHDFILSTTSDFLVALSYAFQCFLQSDPRQRSTMQFLVINPAVLDSRHLRHAEDQVKQLKHEALAKLTTEHAQEDDDSKRDFEDAQETYAHFAEWQIYGPLPPHAIVTSFHVTELFRNLPVLGSIVQQTEHGSWEISFRGVDPTLGIVFQHLTTSGDFRQKYKALLRNWLFSTPGRLPRDLERFSALLTGQLTGLPRFLPEHRASEHFKDGHNGCLRRMRAFFAEWAHVMREDRRQWPEFGKWSETQDQVFDPRFAPV